MPASRALLNGWPLVAGQLPALGAVAPVLLAISGAPEAATVNAFYAFVPSVSGGSGTKAFSLSGTLPAGLSFSSTTGAITGTPTAVGTASDLAIAVTDTSGSATLSGLSIVVSAAALLANGARLMEVGHSFVQNGASGDGTNQANATTGSYNDKSLSSFAQALGAGIRIETFPSADATGSKYYSGASYGFAGETSASTLARFTATGTGVLNVVQAAPDILLIRTGTNNDFASATVITDGQSNFRQMIDIALGAGVKFVVVATMTPAGSVGTTPKAQKLGAWNDMVRALASYPTGANAGKVKILDEAQVYGAGSGWVQAPAGYLQADLLHPAAMGTYFSAKALKTLLDTIVTTGGAWIDGIASPATLTAAREWLTGTTAVNAGTITGNRTTQCTVAANGSFNSTVVLAPRANPAAGTGVVPAGAQFLDFTITPVAGNVQETLGIGWATAPSAAAYPSGWVVGEIEIDIPASPFIVGISLLISQAAASPARTRSAFLQTANTPGPNEARTMKLRTAPVQLSASPGNVIISGTLLFLADAAAQAGAAPMPFSVKRMRWVEVPDPKIAWKAAA